MFKLLYYVCDHELKTDPRPFEAVFVGSKTFEIRKNDRDFQVGQILLLRETRFTGFAMAKGVELSYTGRTLAVRVTHVQTGYGFIEGWCGLSFERLVGTPRFHNTNK